MSKNNPAYNTTPRTSEFVTLTTEQVQAERRSAYAYAFTGPALLTSHDLATLADTLAGERQSCEDEPTTPLGFWPTAVAALLAHADALRHELSAYQLLQAGHEMDCAALAKVGQWDRAEAASELEYTRQMGRETEKAMVKLAGRVKELQAELAEKERAKLLLIQETHNWSAAVKKLEAERSADNQLARQARAKAQAILTGTDTLPANAALIQPRQ